MTEETWVVADYSAAGINEVTFEMLGEARDLCRYSGGQVCAVLLGSGVEGLAGSLASYGADRVYLADNEALASYATDSYVRAMTALVSQRQPSIIMFPATANGSDLGLSLAARLKAPIASDCVKLEFEGGQLVATRPAYGDQVYEQLAFTGSKPYLATIRAGVIGLDRADASRSAEIIKFEPGLDSGAVRTKLTRRFKPDPDKLALNEAEIIIAGGGGADAKEDWAFMAELARALGASIGGSRVAADRGFISPDRVVGQSGVTVDPRLYIAFGISGATHHTHGIKDAKNIIAVNTDRAAPILNMANLKVFCDLHQLLPAFIDEVKRARP